MIEDSCWNCAQANFDGGFRNLAIYRSNSQLTSKESIAVLYTKLDAAIIPHQFNRVSCGQIATTNGEEQ
ncbi:hypothetical protein PK28_12115 [Hymenobacter sp. DG25B]|nr:hypothetical protein PK28_12115 [Hymenobacter sp. DG25B]